MPSGDSINVSDDPIGQVNRLELLISEKENEQENEYGYPKRYRQKKRICSGR